MRVAFFAAMSEELHTVWWEPGAVCLIDQRKLPHEQVTVRCEDVAAVARAIKEMVVRGAPAIGCTAAYGMALVAGQGARADTSYQDALALLDRLRKETPQEQTVSAGIAQWEPGEAAEALVARADSALYDAKNSGRNRVIVASPSESTV